MADEILKRDENHEPVVGFVTDDAAEEIRMGRIDNTTKGLKVMLIGGAGSGTVTTVSVVTANGISGTVATATTTPAITLALGAITPTSVNGLTLASQAIGFTIAGGTTSKTLTVPLDASVSGTNTGDQDLSGLVTKATYDANTILYATTDNTPVALTVGEQTVVGRATGGAISALAIDSDLSSVSANDDTVPSAKATKAMGDLKLALAGGTMTGKQTSAGRDEVGKTYTPATGSQTVALDCAVNNIHIVTGHADGTAITFTVANATNSQCFIVSILQGANTPSTIAGWFATVRWAGGSAPTLTATINKRDTFGFIRTGNNTYDGFIIGQAC